MIRLTVIADELTALGWRLADAQVRVPEPHAVHACFAAAAATAAGQDVVLITAELAAQMPPGMLEAALVGAQPLVLVIPDARHREAPSDVEREVLSALGVAA